MTQTIVDLRERAAAQTLDRAEAHLAIYQATRNARMCELRGNYGLAADHYQLAADLSRWLAEGGAR